MTENKQNKTYTRRFSRKPINSKLLVDCPTIRVLKKYGRFNKAAADAGFLKNPVSSDSDRFEVYDTTSGGYHADLSPMILGPVHVDGQLFALNIEDGWQGCKVWSFHMRGHFDEKSKTLWKDEPNKAKHPIESDDWIPEWEKWSKHIRLSGEAKRHRAKADPNAVNPNVPLFSYFQGQRLDYVSARKQMYIPWYAELVQKTESFQYLKVRFQAGTSLILLDPDGQPRDQLWIHQDVHSLTSRINEFSLIFGHGFVLAAVLMEIKVW